jgi:hypothetical protein
MRDVQLVADLGSGQSERDEPYDVALPRGDARPGGVRRHGAPEASAPARRAQRHDEDELPTRDCLHRRRPLHSHAATVAADQFGVAGRPPFRQHGRPRRGGQPRAAGDKAPERLTDDGVARMTQQRQVRAVDVQMPAVLVGKRHRVAR